MTSSVDNPSDNGDTSEQHSHPEPQLQSTCQVTGISHPVMAPPNMQYVMPPTLGAGNAMATAAFPYADPYCRSVFTPYDSHSYPPQPYPAQPMVHLQLMGIQQPGVPLPSDAIEEPVFVNAKQYHGILRRRQSRAKAESEAKAAKSRKPYLHESRHLHALRRARGTGGRFLNAKKGSNQPNERKSSDKPESNINLNGEKDDQASSESAS